MTKLAFGLECVDSFYDTCAEPREKNSVRSSVIDKDKNLPERRFLGCKQHLTGASYPLCVKMTELRFEKIKSNR